MGCGGGREQVLKGDMYVYMGRAELLKTIKAAAETDNPRQRSQFVSCT